ncbi:uncharacterized protein LOC120347110 [Styela clava]
MCEKSSSSYNVSKLSNELQKILGSNYSPESMTNMLNKCHELGVYEVRDLLRLEDDDVSDAMTKIDIMKFNEYKEVQLSAKPYMGENSDLTNEFLEIFGKSFPEDSMKKLLERCKNIGVYAIEDIRLMDESDVSDILKKLDVKKFNEYKKTKQSSTPTSGLRDSPKSRIIKEFLTIFGSHYPEESLQKLMAVCEDIGVHDVEDIQIIEEDDLTDILKKLDIEKFREYKVKKGVQINAVQANFLVANAGNIQSLNFSNNRVTIGGHHIH